MRSALACLALASGLAWAATASAKAGATPKLPVMGEVPTFSYLDHQGHRISNADLLGQVWIADFIFTQCKTACPLLSARLVMLQRRIADPKVAFVSFSVDPAHDTPEVLKAYAARWRQDPRWHLLATTKRSLLPLVTRMGIIVHETGDADDPIIHSNGFLLVDASGFIRGSYSSEDEEQMKRLVVDLSQLTSGATASPVTASPPTAGGAELFAELGCQGCHADPHLASPLGGLFGRTIKLADDRSVRVDEAYLRESILAPSAKIAAGYTATMPSYEGALSRAQLDALVAFVKALPAAAAKPAERRAVIDPVCKMQLSAGPDTAHVDHDGKTHYFCSEACRQRFVSDPTRYAAP